MYERKKVMYISTVPLSLNLLLKGQLKMLSDYYDVVAVSSPGDDLEMVRQREKVRTERVVMRRCISPVDDLFSLIRLISLIKREKPWMVHSLTPKAGLLSMIASWACRVPVRIHTFTGLLFPTAKGVKRLLLMTTDRITCMCATHINPEGKGVMRDLAENRITQRPLKIIGNGNINGIDCDYYAKSNGIIQRAESIVSTEYVTFCFVGRVVRDKGIEELISAFERLRNECKQVRLILVGTFEKELDPISESTMHIIEKDEMIEFVGWQDDIRPYLAASDIFIFPSYREGFPNVVLQAGAMGLPCIVTDINGSNEIIQNGENGIIVQPHDVNRLYRAMLYLIDNKEERIRMAQNVRKSIVARYEQHELWNELVKFYNEIENGNK